MAKKLYIDDQLEEAINSAPFAPAELARRAGVTPALISRFINGKRTLRLTTAAKLADVLGLDLVQGEQPSKKRPTRKRKAR